MNMRAWFRTAALISAALLASPAAHAQLKDLVPESKVPAKVSKALRERVTQFFAFHTGSVNRRGLELVAEDTKDFYYNTQKTVYNDYRLEKVEFTRDQKKAMVWGKARRPMTIQGQTLITDSEVITTWKLEQGKWFWYVDLNSLITPLGLTGPGPSGGLQQKTSSTPNTPLLDELTKPENLMAQAQTILKQSGVDKSETTFTFGVKGSDEFTFENGFPGQVMLELAGAQVPVPGVKVTLLKKDLQAREKSVVRVEYDPAGELPPITDRQTHTVNLLLQPFNQIFPLKLNFNPPQPK
jgi:hypothetical protein